MTEPDGSERQPAHRLARPVASNAHAALNAARSNEIRAALISGELDQAARLLDSELRAAPYRYDLQGHSGYLAVRLGRPRRAALAYRRAVALAPDHLESRYNLALSLRSAGTAMEASAHLAALVDTPEVGRRSLGHLVRSLVDNAEGPRAWSLLAPRRAIWSDDAELVTLAGRALVQCGQPEPAIAVLRRALRMVPGHATAVATLVTVLLDTGRHHQAASLLHETGTERAVSEVRAVLEERRDAYPVVDGLAQAFVGIGDADGLRHLVEICTDSGQSRPETWNTLSIALKKLRLLEESHTLSRRAIAHFPEIPELPFNLAHNLQEEERPTEAEPWIRRALALRPRYAKAWNTLGVIRLRLRDLTGARQALTIALELDPALFQAHLNLGNAWRADGRVHLALAYYRRALEIAPDYAEAHHNLGVTLIELGELEQGFKAHEWRWKLPNFPSRKRPFRQRIWSGQPLDDQGLVVWLEQGIGDEIFFSWPLSLVRRQARRMAVECADRLVPLLQRSFPTLPFYPRRMPPHPALLDPGLQWKIPSGHLPGIVWPEIKLEMRRLSSLPSGRYRRTSGFVVPDPRRVAYWKRRLAERAQGRPAVGISWTSAVVNGSRIPNYMTLEEMIRCLDHPVLAVNLQYNWTEADVGRLHEADRCSAMRFFHPEGIDLRNDLDDLAALMCALDLVLTTFTSVGMMAGGVGTPTWVFQSSEYRRTWEQFGAPFVPFLPSVEIFWRVPGEPWLQTIGEINDAMAELCRQWPEPRL